MGDSAIVETVGLGAFAMAAAPAVVGYVGEGRASEAAAFTRSMAEIAVREGITDNYVSNLIHLAWLSPDLVGRD